MQLKNKIDWEPLLHAAAFIALCVLFFGSGYVVGENNCKFKGCDKCPEKKELYIEIEKDKWIKQQ